MICSVASRRLLCHVVSFNAMHCVLWQFHTLQSFNIMLSYGVLCHLMSRHLTLSYVMLYHCYVMLCPLWDGVQIDIISCTMSCHLTLCSAEPVIVTLWWCHIRFIHSPQLWFTSLSSVSYGSFYIGSCRIVLWNAYMKFVSRLCSWFPAFRGLYLYLANSNLCLWARGQSERQDIQDEPVLCSCGILWKKSS